MGRFQTQRAFHRVQEHPKRTILRTKKLWLSEVGGHYKKIRWTKPSRGYCFVSFSDIIGVQVALSYIWVDCRLKGFSIESKNSHNKILLKELCKLQAMKKISNLWQLKQQQLQPLFLVILGCSIKSIWDQDIYWLQSIIIYSPLDCQ